MRVTESEIDGDDGGIGYQYGATEETEGTEGTDKDGLVVVGDSCESPPRIADKK